MEDTITRGFPCTIISGLALVGMAGSAQAASEHGEAKLAKALEGYAVAGEPADCIRQRDIRSTRIFDGTAILYTMIGGKRYVNRPDTGIASLRPGDVMVTDTRSPDLCGIDVVKLYDSVARMPSGFVGLGEFVPYEKVERSAQ